MTPRRQERLAYLREYSRERRKLLSSVRLCINGGSHGQATHGVRCEACAVVHRKSS